MVYLGGPDLIASVIKSEYISTALTEGEVTRGCMREVTLLALGREKRHHQPRT